MRVERPRESGLICELSITHGAQADAQNPGDVSSSNRLSLCGNHRALLLAQPKMGRSDNAERPEAYGLDSDVAGTFVACVGEGPTRLPPASADSLVGPHFVRSSGLVGRMYFATATSVGSVRTIALRPADGARSLADGL